MPNNQHPHSVEAEQALVGYVLVHPDEYMTVDIELEDFYVHKHRYVWAAIKRLRERDRGIDFVTIVDELGNANRLDEIGGPAFVTKLMTDYPLGFSPHDSATIVREHAQRRHILQLAGDMARVAQNENIPIDTKTSDFIDRLVSTSRIRGGAVHWSHYLSELYDEIDERYKDPQDIWGIPTGFGMFDKVTGGLQLGEFMILSGVPGVGKSIWAMQAAEQMADYAPGALYSLEMGGKQVMRRIVSARARVRTSRMKSGKLEGGDWEAIVKAIQRMEDKPVFMSDATGWTTTALRADLARLKLTKGVKWFVFDYMLLANDAAGQDETERTAAISRGLKLVCRHLDLAGLTVHSMNKTGMEASLPNQGNLRGSGQVSYDADLICFLTEFKPMSETDTYISKADTDNMRTLIFGKGRELEDPRKYIHMVKLPAYPAFGDYAQVAA